MADERKVEIGVLVKALPKRFGRHYEDGPEMTYDAAAYRISTYLKDKYDSDEVPNLKKLKKHLPFDLYVLALEKFAMADYDT